MSIDESSRSMDLKKIASFLRTRQESAEYLEKVAKDKNIYIRVSYSGFRAISIHPKQPCGAVPGFNRLLKFAQPSTPAEQREKMTASPDEQ